MNEKLSDWTDLELLSEIIRLKPTTKTNMVARLMVEVYEKELDRRNDERAS
jgi:hypothetical protein